ncbi:MAG: ATPase domain-containing protein, partial [Bacteroidales bacterium]
TLGSVEIDRLLGGGLVEGSLVLLGGEPGIGKSTLALQVALHCKGLKTLYVSGEESPKQIKLRAQRLGGDQSQCSVLCETVLENIV